MATGIRWADVDSDDESHLSIAESEDVLEGTGYVFSQPITIRGIVISCVGDFLANIDYIYSVYCDINDDEYAAQMWAEYVQDITNNYDYDDLEAALRDFRLHFDEQVLSTEGMDLPAPEPIAVSDADIQMQLEQADLIADAANEMGIDTLIHDTSASKIEFQKVQLPADNRGVITGQIKAPPLCPDIKDGMPVKLRYKRKSVVSGSIFEDRKRWDEELESVLTGICPQSTSTLLDDDTYRSSRSNIRPQSKPPVMLVWPDGHELNIGVHGYLNTVDIDIALDFKGIDDALQELFCAPAGEGLTTATPSHMLHQIISAVYSHAVKDYNVLVEHSGADMVIESVKWRQMHNGQMTTFCEDLNLDITSSASIHSKQLAPDKKHPEYRTQGAVSKYDMAAALRWTDCDRALQCVYKNICLSLSCEFPDFFNHGYKDMTPDLKLQHEIHHVLSSMPSRTIQSLAEMSYNAAIMECVDLANATNFDTQGKSFMEKKQVLIDKIDSLKSRNRVAFPPIPLSDITGFESRADQIEILGHIMDMTNPVISPKELGHRYHIGGHEANDSFMKHFPACGLVSYEDSKVMASGLDSGSIILKGNTHKGPMPGCRSTDPAIVEQVDSFYSESALAQYLEIRCDVVRAVHKYPYPPVGSWNQAWIYKSKVCIWYRGRDAPNSADGYRIDWFGVSTFKTAGSIPVTLKSGQSAFLWPRQKIRSQEMDLIKMAPRRFKAVLFSMIEKSASCRCSLEEVYAAWERMLLTTNTSTWASGPTFITSRYLSSSLSSPSSPFDTMAKKIVQPRTFADVAYLVRMRKVLVEWVERDQYHDRSPILGLPRQMSQLESYWKDWVPNEFADADRNMAECVKDLYLEHLALVDTQETRVRDLESQLSILMSGRVTLNDLRKSLRDSTSIDTDGKFGWSFIGSLASGYALNLKTSVSAWDKQYAYGRVSRTMVDHLTVRHSARIDSQGNIEKGTVAELMLRQGTDDYLSKTDQSFRFMFGSLPVFFNHPKKGEHKNREISITDPDSRIMLSDAELISGMYGASTGVDFLKVPTKDQKFYQKAERVLLRGGAIQSSDATRYGPMMSNYAISIMMLYLGSYSMHFKWSSCVYARLAHRQMLLPTSVRSKLERQVLHDDTRDTASATLKWLSSLPEVAHDESTSYVAYCDSHHMGQGMSHHGSSLMHAGALLVTHNAADYADIWVHSTKFQFKQNIMVTSDDSTSIPEPVPVVQGVSTTRPQRQTAAHMYLKVIRAMRPISLRMVSVSPNLPKEIIAGNKGEFNSNDSGIGSSCPMLGFRELISLLVPPTSPSLIGDYLDAHANAKTVAFSGQGLASANYFHAMRIDSIEERWRLNDTHLQQLKSMSIVPNQLITGAVGTELCSSPSSWLHINNRASLLQISIENNLHREDIDPHVKDSVFGPMMHVRVAMAKQHRKAIDTIKAYAVDLERKGMSHASRLLEDTLRSTISSARTRNLGRVASRVRSQHVVPPPFFLAGKVHEFIKEPVLDSTMRWLQFLEGHVRSHSPSPTNIKSALEMAGFIRIAHNNQYSFPNPPRRRRHYHKKARKPRYITAKYGCTPFGRHAIERGRMTPVKQVGPVEREEVLRYYAAIQYRSFTEHVEYGGTFVTSWLRKQAGKIVALDLAEEIEPQEAECIKYGSFDEESIGALKHLQVSNPDLPVLALHRLVGYQGTFHCVYQGEALTVELDIKGDETPRAILHQYHDGRSVLCAIQGIEESPTWTGSPPKKHEVDRYVSGPLDMDMPDIVYVLQHSNIKHQRVTVPTYSTVVSIDNEPTVLYTSPSITQYPSVKNGLDRHLPYLRSRVVAEVAMGGYWHNHIRGVCFRSFLREHFQDNTVWTGSTIGWHASPTNIPTYTSTGVGSNQVKGVLVLNGLETGDELSPYNVDIFSTGFTLVSGGSTTHYSHAIQVPDNLSGAIFDANNRNRHFLDSDTQNVLDIPYSSVPATLNLSQREAIRTLQAYFDDDMPVQIF